MRAVHDDGRSWDGIASEFEISDRTARTRAASDMTAKAHGERFSHAGRRLTVTSEENAEIISCARARREEHEVVDIAWTGATISDIPDGRLSKVHDSFVSRFWPEQTGQPVASRFTLLGKPEKHSDKKLRSISAMLLMILRNTTFRWPMYTCRPNCNVGPLPPEPGSTRIPWIRA
jgi:hypothetical protein